MKITSHNLLITLCLASLFTFSACKEDEEATPVDVVSTEEPTVQIKTLLTDRGIIWGMDFLPNGDLLFTEKSGKLSRYSKGTISEITGLPNDISAAGQGGLLDLKVHPKYAENGWIYMAYSSVNASNAGKLQLIRFKLNADNVISNAASIFATDASNTWLGHYGCRIAFDKQGLLYLSVGEGGAGSYGGASSPHQNAQNVKSAWGKVHRMTDNGGVPDDNPVLAGNTTATTIFSYGHRNPQSLALNPFTNEIWEAEHGPMGGDEINIIRASKNYGWPLYSYGLNYDGTVISQNPAPEGIEKPVLTWTPSIGACGMDFITHNNFKKWKGNVLIGSLAKIYLSRCEISGNVIVKEHKLLEYMGRVRNVKQSPDGIIYVSLENPGRIIQIIPS